MAIFLLRNSLDSAASEEHDTLQPLVIKEIIERPLATVFSERIRHEIRIVRINIALVHRNLVLDRRPQLLAQHAVLIASGGAQIRIDCVHHPLQGRLLAELVTLQKKQTLIGRIGGFRNAYFGVREVVIGLESRVQRCD